jgi:hypothetical protein
LVGDDRFGKARLIRGGYTKIGYGAPLDPNRGVPSNACPKVTQTIISPTIAAIQTGRLAKEGVTRSESHPTTGSV